MSTIAVKVEPDSHARYGSTVTSYEDTKNVNPAVANIGALKPHHRRPQSSMANTYRKEPIDKRASIDSRFSKN